MLWEELKQTGSQVADTFQRVATGGISALGDAAIGNVRGALGLESAGMMGPNPGTAYPEKAAFAGANNGTPYDNTEANPGNQENAGESGFLSRWTTTEKVVAGVGIATIIALGVSQASD